ncbi:Arginase/deacetylase [Cytidiella melzeri]|nr:Arginase/deacetylase [Cytidiella melzeri]
MHNNDLGVLAFVAALFLPLISCHDHSGHVQTPLTGPDSHSSSSTATHKNEWLAKYGPQIDQTFSGPLSFSHLPYIRCLEDTSAGFDIALLGMPFDTGVSYRPGARFGPYGIRSGSRRQRESRGWTLSWQTNPYAQGSRIIDCGDVPVNAMDNALAVDQMEVAYSTLLNRPVVSKDDPSMSFTKNIAKDGVEHPRIVSLGGDHTIVLPILRALNKVYGPVSVIHFDAHLDTWPGYPGATTEQSRITHGTFFNIAHEEKLMRNSSVHAGIRCKLAGLVDLEHDQHVGFEVISTDDIDDLGIGEIIRRIRSRIGDSPVYLSFDIDVIDPGLAPATGTPEAGGWTTREVKRIIRGLAGLNFVGVDLVEVAPAYDTNAEVTATVAADLVHDFLSMLMTKELPQPRRRSTKDEL